MSLRRQIMRMETSDRPCMLIGKTEVILKIDDIVEQIYKKDTYPEDIFLPLSKGDIAFAVSVLENACVNVDRYSAHLMRIAERNMQEFCLKLLAGSDEE